MSLLHTNRLPEEGTSPIQESKISNDRSNMNMYAEVQAQQRDDSPLCEASLYEREGDNNETLSLSPSLASSNESSVSTTMAEMNDDLKYSVPSDLLFLLGSLIAVYTSVADWGWLFDYYYYYSDDYAYDNDDGNVIGSEVSSDDDTPSSLDTYTILSIVGSFALVLNPTYDLSCCIYKLKQNPEITSIFHKEMVYDTSSSIAFGIAALIDLRSTLLYEKETASKLGLMGILSAHFYLLSALISLSKSTFQYSTIVKRLWFVGDVLFLMASLVDVAISYISDPVIISESKQVLYGCWLFSSVLWLIDALLYIMADVYIWFSTKDIPGVCHYLFWRKKNPSEIEPIPMDLNLYIEELSMDQNSFEREEMCLQSKEGGPSPKAKMKKGDKLKIIKKHLASPIIRRHKAKVKPMSSTPDNLCIANSPSNESLL